jgi:hypothetical protein
MTCPPLVAMTPCPATVRLFHTEAGRKNKGIPPRIDWLVGWLAEYASPHHGLLVFSSNRVKTPSWMARLWRAMMKNQFARAQWPVVSRRKQAKDFQYMRWSGRMVLDAKCICLHDG